jgi:acyl carrier protein
MTADAILSETLAILSRIAASIRTPADVGPATPLTDGGFWLDSVEILEVVVACEERFGVVFDAEMDLTTETLKTVENLAAVIRAKKAG